MILKTINKFYDTDIGYSFFNSKIAIISSSIFFIIFLCSLFAGIVAPYNPFDPASVFLMDAFTYAIAFILIVGANSAPKDFTNPSTPDFDVATLA